LCFASKSTFSKKVGKANQNDLYFSHRVTHTTLEEEMSQLLREFLSAYLEWVDAGAVNGEPFSRRVGLCSNFRGSAFCVSDIDEIKRVCMADGLDEHYPFGGEDQYGVEQSGYTMHLNPARIAWVRSKVAQFEMV
jgi:hypothetical protein